MPTVTTSPWQAAVDRISSKTVVGSRLDSTSQRLLFEPGNFCPTAVGGSASSVVAGTLQANAAGTSFVATLGGAGLPTGLYAVCFQASPNVGPFRKVAVVSVR